MPAKHHEQMLQLHNQNPKRAARFCTVQVEPTRALALALEPHSRASEAMETSTGLGSKKARQDGHLTNIHDEENPQNWIYESACNRKRDLTTFYIHS